jgi:ankyrin repeat protein
MRFRSPFAFGGALLVMSLPLLGAASKSPIADAVMNGDKAALRTLVKQKADVNAAQVDGATALHWAIYRDDADTVEFLIGAGANIKAANREGITPLAMAALYGNTAILNKLLKGGADAKQRGPNGETMLMLAARNGNPQAIRMLVEAGAEVNVREPLRGTTALMWAVDQKNSAAVKALLASGANPALKSGGAGLPRNYMAGRVNTAQVRAAQERHMRAAAAGRTYEEQLKIEGVGGRFGGFGGNLAASQAAAAGGGQPQGAGAAGQQGGGRGQGGRGRGQGGAAGAADAPAAPSAAQAPAAAQAPGSPQAAEVQQDDDDDSVIVAGLVGSGGGGLTALVLAAREGDLESAKALVDAKADVNQVTEYGWSPLLVATNNRHYKLAAYLIERGADVNLANKGNWTPLYIATDNRNIEGGDYPVPKPDLDHLDFIKLLLARGANPNARAKDNTLSRTIFTMQWFQENGATPFIRAAQSSDTELMKLLLQHGADPKIATEYGDTALTAAAGVGWVEGVTYEHSVKENYEAIRMLLDLGLDPNAANQDGRTPLMVAAMKGRTAVIELLVERGAKLDQRDRGSRDTDTTVSVNAGHTWQAVDYADGLVRVGVQSAVNRPEAAGLLRKMMLARGFPPCDSVDRTRPVSELPKTCVPPPNRIVDSVCIVEICLERLPAVAKP